MIRLSPSTPGSGPSLAGLESLLCCNFDEVSIDREEGRSQKAVHIETLKRLGAPASLVGHRESLNAGLVTLENAGDDQYLEFLYFPGEEIVIGFSSATHEKMATPLAEMLGELLFYIVSYE